MFDWYKTIDKTILCCTLSLIGLGIFLSFAASPAVAERLNLDSFYFVKRHIITAIIAILLIIVISTFNVNKVKYLSLFIFFISIILMVSTLFVGAEIKGAKRWINLYGNSLQPSELIKPAMIILNAWFLSEKNNDPNFNGASFSLFILFLVLSLLLMQPDLGMSIIISLTWSVQLFIAGIPIFYIISGFITGVFGIFGAYMLLPHVNKRLNQFLFPQSNSDLNELYQVKQSLNAFMNGGFFGKGPGEGIIKKNVPDSHADFVFAIAGEEFGLWICILIATLYLVIIIKSLFKAINHNHNIFLIIGIAGISFQIGMQALINMGSSLNILPTKGMTLPFISYGGSSLISSAINIGILLAISKNDRLSQFNSFYMDRSS